MKKALTVFCRGEEEGSVQRKAARNYLVIPKSRRVYLILPKGLEKRRVLELCREIQAMEGDGNDFVVYVFVQRGNALAELLQRTFPGRGTIQPIVTGSKANFFIYASDVVLTKAGLLSLYGASEMDDLGQWHILHSGNFRDMIQRAVETVKARNNQEEHS